MRCTHPDAIYTALFVKQINRKVGFAVVLAALVLLGAGCGGISGSQSISPASFLLPGLIQNDPPVDSSAPLHEVEPEVQITQVQ